MKISLKFYLKRNIWIYKQLKNFLIKLIYINIFDRKDIINKIFNDKINKVLNEILNKNDFKNLKQIWNLKSNDRISFLEKVDKDDIINIYIEK